MEQVSTTVNYISGLSPVVIDLILGVIILAVGLLYARKGLYQCAATGLVLVLSIVIGITVANLAEEPVLDIVWEKYGPTVEQSFDEKVESIKTGTFNYTEELKKGWNAILEKIGFAQLEVLKVDDDTDVDYNNSEVVESLKIYTLVKSKLFVSKFLKVVLFGLATALALLILTFVKNMIGELTKLPVIKWVNIGGGFLVGVAGALIVMLIIVRVCNLVGIDFFNNLREGTVLLNWIAQGDMNDAVELVKNFDIESIKNIDFEAEAQKLIESYDNSQLSEGADSISEMVKNLSTDDLQTLIDNVANKINQY